jgi:hypothetical protein
VLDFKGAFPVLFWRAFWRKPCWARLPPHRHRAFNKVIHKKDESFTKARQIKDLRTDPVPELRKQPQVHPVTGSAMPAGKAKKNGGACFCASAAAHRRGTRASPCCPRKRAWASDYCGAQNVRVKQKISLPALAYAQKK